VRRFGSIDAALSVIDTNNDQFISHDEFVTALKRWDNPAATMEEIEMLWNAIDFQYLGKISLWDLRKLLARTRNPNKKGRRRSSTSTVGSANKRRSLTMTVVESESAASKDVSSASSRGRTLKKSKSSHFMKSTPLKGKSMSLVDLRKHCKATNYDFHLSYNSAPQELQELLTFHTSSSRITPAHQRKVTRMSMKRSPRPWTHLLPKSGLTINFPGGPLGRLRAVKSDAMRRLRPRNVTDAEAEEQDLMRSMRDSFRSRMNSPSSPILSPHPHHQDTTSPHHHHQDAMHTTHSTIQAVSPGIPLGILPSFSHTAISESSPTTVTPALRIYETDDVGRRNRTQGEINVQLDKLESWAPCRDDVVPTEAIHQRAFLAAYNSLAASTKGMTGVAERANNERAGADRNRINTNVSRRGR